MYVGGLYKDKVDERDVLARNYIADLRLPVAYDLTDKMSPVRNQQDEGSCAGFAMAVGVKEYQERKEHKRLIELSPRFIYEEAKKISGHSEGTTLRAIMQVAKEMGVCEECLWPYEPNNIPAPGKGYTENAYKYRIKTYARVLNIDELKSAIFDLSMGAIIIGVKVYKTMVNEQAQTTGIVENPSCFDSFNVLGGHALCAVGYNNLSPYFKGDGHVKCKNSWGDKYGEKGYCYLSYKYIKSNMLDAYSCIDTIIMPPDKKVLHLSSIERKRSWV